MSGYKQALEENNIEYDISKVYEGNVDYESGIELAKKLYKNGLDVTAIVATADILAIGAIKGLYEVGVKVPDDISIIGFDDLEVSRYLIPGLTTIRQDISEKGEKAIQLLLNNIQDSEITKREIIIPVRIVARDSVKKNI